MSNVWFPAENALLGQNIDETSTTQKVQIGTIVKAKHASFGVCEFIYLLGVANTIVGSCVTYSLVTGVTALAAVGSNLPRPVAYAMSANVASQWGWYQIGGMAVAAKAVATSFAAGAAVGVKTTGLVAATGTGKEIQGALVAVVASAKSDVSTVKLIINRPHMQGRVT